MRICLVYDCLYPYTVGGAERWYRNLAAELVAAGHEVTYLTRRQWPAGEAPDVPGVRVVAVAPGGELYGPGGQRRIGPPLRFGAGVARHLAGARGRYDVVHTCAFPYFSLLGARAALAGAGTALAVDWFEVWTHAYWRSYLGRVGGGIGWGVQRACVALTPLAFVFSNLHARRLAAEGLRGRVERLEGAYNGSLEPVGDPRAPRAPLVVFAGRHIAEKRAELIPGAIALARRRIPGLRALILGDGPRHDALRAEIARFGLDEVAEAPGFVAAEQVSEALARASCHVLPSAREGYGMVVIEAAAAGTPSAVVAGPDNAATELVVEGVNGFVAPVATPRALAATILAVQHGGAELRARTTAWFAHEAPRLSAAASARHVAAVYARLSAPRPR